MEIEAMASVSGGKDSVAMLLRMLEINKWIDGGHPDWKDKEKYPLTRAVFADTEKEFPELYEYLDKVQEYIDEHYPETGLKIEYVYSKKTWDEWFYGRSTRGKSEGQVRGAPLIAFPCWWAREAKLYPLQRATKDCEISYVGIASDEMRRVSKHAEAKGIRYPLIEWGWTEADAFKYLDNIKLVNPLYVHFNRLGCFHCPKQPAKSWYMLWKKYPELWEESKRWDKESLRETENYGKHGLTNYESIEELEQKFKDGFVPEGRRPFECNSCDAVSMFHDDQQGIVDTWGEGEDLHQDDAMSCELTDPGSAQVLARFKWIKKSDSTEPQEWW